MSFRLAMQKAAASIYMRLGADVKYHSIGGVVSEIKAIESTTVDYSPDGFMATVQENDTVYYILNDVITNPTKGDFIIDEGKRFDVVTVEPKGRFEWALIVREVI